MSTLDAPGTPHSHIAQDHSTSSRGSVDVEIVVNSAGGKTTLGLGDVELPLTFERLSARLVERGYAAPALITCHPGAHDIEVTDGPSWFTPRQGGYINIDQPFMHFYWQVYIPAIRKMAGDVPSAYRVSSKDHVMIEVGGVNIQLQRTIRVPDSGNAQALPPSMGTFKMYNVADYADRLPKSIVSKGGVFVAMYQREAMWILFAPVMVNDDPHRAVKVSVGGVNAVTGEPQNANNTGKQDYLAINPSNGQLWLDGICTAPGIVRQLVAMPLGNGYTVEGQVTGKEDISGLQIDVFEPLPATVEFTRDGQVIDAYNTPRRGGMHVQSSVHMTDCAAASVTLRPGKTVTSSALLACQPVQLRAYIRQVIRVYVKNIMGRETELVVPTSYSVCDLKKMLHAEGQLPPDQLRLIFAGKQLRDECKLDDCNVPDNALMHSVPRLSGGDNPDYVARFMAADRISQKINRDPLPPQAYDQSRTTRLHITVINAAYFKELTGHPAPPTPVSADTYIKHKLPWYTFYDEQIPAANIGYFNPLSKVKSVAEVDADWGATEQSRPQSECVHCTYGKVAFRLVPCRHLICNECALGLSGDVCPACPATVQRRKRIVEEHDDQRFGLEEGSYDDRVIHLKRLAGGNKAASFILQEHYVSKLSGEGRA